MGFSKNQHGGQGWSGLVSVGQGWSGLVRAGQGWSVLVRAGQCWSGLVRAGSSIPGGKLWKAGRQDGNLPNNIGCPNVLHSLLSPDCHHLPCRHMHSLCTWLERALKGHAAHARNVVTALFTCMHFPRIAHSSITRLPFSTCPLANLVFTCGVRLWLVKFSPTQSAN